MKRFFKRLACFIGWHNWRTKKVTGHLWGFTNTEQCEWCGMICETCDSGVGGTSSYDRSEVHPIQ